MPTREQYSATISSLVMPTLVEETVPMAKQLKDGVKRWHDERKSRQSVEEGTLIHDVSALKTRPNR